MPRTAPPDRFDQLVARATDVFIEQGYRRTQMADVADAMGVAKGTLYLYVESKEALFDLTCRYADAEPPLQRPAVLPVATPAPGATLAYVADRLAQNSVPATLVAALERRRAAPVRDELAAIVTELYGVLARNRRGIKLIDRSARDYPELADLWFSGARGGLLVLLTRYLEDRVRRKLVAPVPDLAAAAKLMLETIVFWAVHRHWDAKPLTLDADIARKTVLRFVVDALAPADVKARRPHHPPTRRPQSARVRRRGGPS